MKSRKWTVATASAMTVRTNSLSRTTSLLIPPDLILLLINLLIFDFWPLGSN